MYIHPESGRTFANHSLIRAALTNTLFPEVINDEMLAFAGVFPIVPTDPGTAPNQTALEALPEHVDGVWRQTWTLRPATAEELAARAPVVPQQVPMLNARLAMIAAGWMADVKEYLASLTGIEGEQAREFFEFALTIRRDHPLVEGFRVTKAKSHAEVDQLFFDAEALNV